MMKGDREHIGEHLLLQYLLGNLGGEERNRVDQWLNESNRNRKELDQLEAIWLETGMLSPPPLDVKTGAAWDKLSRRIDLDEKRKVKDIPMWNISGPLFRWVSGVAALILLSLGILWFVKYMNTPETTDIIAGNAIVRDTLPDGSVITLNVNSNLKHLDRFSGRTREVRLSGEAFFDVVPDKENPFIVDAGTGKVLVTGTSFNVKAVPGTPLIVTVTQGAVMLFRVHPVSGDTVSLMITAGQQGVMASDDPAPHFNTPEDNAPLFWLDRTLVFHDTPLSHVIDEIKKYYSITITTSDTTQLDCRLTATFTDEPVELILKVIAESFNLNVIQENQTYKLVGNGCSK